MTDTPGADRAKLFARLKALRAMTVENGCSEEEAMNAARKADSLMQQLGADATDDDVKGDKYGARKRPLNGNIQRKADHEVRFCTSAIARFADCESWGEQREGEGRILAFFGTAEDTETAHWLADVIRVSMETECHRYLASRDRDRHLHGRSVRPDFMLGMARRINERLDEMTRARKAAIREATAGTSRALVIVNKTQVVTEKYAQYLRDRKMVMGKRRTSRIGGRSAAAREAGMAAGDRVGFGRPVSGGSSGPAMIGRG